MRFEREGEVLHEELIGRDGFEGPSSLLYHRHLPETAQDVVEGIEDDIPVESEKVHEHAHLEGFRLQAHGDTITGRQWLLVNDDVRIGLLAPQQQQEVLFVDASADDVLFVHAGSGTLRTQFGRIGFSRHDFLVIPRGTVYRLELDGLDAARLLVMEVTGAIDAPDRYRCRSGQLTEAAPYSERDLRGPEALEGESGPVQVWVKRASRISCYSVDQHPFDVVGWDGSVYPVAFNIHDFEPRAGRFALPLPEHQAFAATNVAIHCLVPRRSGSDAEAAPLPYHHMSLDRDEVRYFVETGQPAPPRVRPGSLTHHVGGLPHGPILGERSATSAEAGDLAIGVETARPLHRTQLARQVIDSDYRFSWRPATTG